MKPRIILRFLIVSKSVDITNLVLLACSLHFTNKVVQKLHLNLKISKQITTTPTKTIVNQLYVNLTSISSNQHIILENGTMRTNYVFPS